MTYVRTPGRGFTLDDPDTIAWLCTTISSIIYIVYNTTVLVHPEQYGTNFLYTYADILYFIGACFYVFAALRDENWFWFLPVTDQYGIASGRVKIECEKPLPRFGKPPVLITSPCRKCVQRKNVVKNKDNDDIIVNRL